LVDQRADEHIPASEPTGSEAGMAVKSHCAAGSALDQLRCAEQTSMVPMQPRGDSAVACVVVAAAVALLTPVNVRPTSNPVEIKVNANDFVDFTMRVLLVASAP
jgi:hypothetical protein